MTAPNPHVLVINAGSSSLKYQLIDTATDESLASGLIERIGSAEAVAHHTVDGTKHEQELDCLDHGQAMQILSAAFAEHGPEVTEESLIAVGHRVVHGGATFSSAVVIDDDVIAAITDLIPLAPLHNPGNLAGIEQARLAFPSVPQVAVFDTAFHATMSPAASTYAVPKAWREEHGVRKYGFHGTSHAYVSRRAADLMDLSVSDTNVIVLHLGNGASACAVEGGKSVDTSMGLTPMDGLIMGTRPGDLDPSLPGHLSRVAGLSLEDYDKALAKQSGLQGLTGSADFREVMTGYQAGEPEAQLAVEAVVHRIVRHVGALAAVLGRVDAIAFTAGIGENNAVLRELVMLRLGILGVVADEAANNSAEGEALISADSSHTQVWVIPTNEEGEIAQQSATLVAS